jgi:hypothetical protein
VKQLRLSGVLATLETRLLEAQTRNLSALDVISDLLQDELDRRHTRLLDKCLQSSGLSERASLAEFDWAYNPQIPKRTCFELNTLKFIAEGSNAILVGNPRIAIVAAFGPWAAPMADRHRSILHDRDGDYKQTRHCEVWIYQSSDGRDQPTADREHSGSPGPFGSSVQLRLDHRVWRWESAGSDTWNFRSAWISTFLLRVAGNYCEGSAGRRVMPERAKGTISRVKKGRPDLPAPRLECCFSRFDNSGPVPPVRDSRRPLLRRKIARTKRPQFVTVSRASTDMARHTRKY